MLYKIGKHFLISSFFIAAFLLPQSSYATDPPNLLSPADNSTIEKSPKLIWEYTGGCVESGSCFRVEVDNSDDFSAPEKSTYTNNYSYSPQGLSENTWYWRVKAKDTSGIWTGWSSEFKFIISSQIIPSSTPSQTSSPTPGPTSESSKKYENVFSIKDAPSEINSNQEFDVAVSLLIPNNKDQSFYLKGAFKTSDSSNYFGETNAGGWIKNSAKYSEQLKIKTDSEGKWEGKIKIKPDDEDSGFKGTGNYILKVGRYSESGSGPTWSNELNLRINAVDTPIKSPSAEQEEEISEKEDEKIDITASLVNSPKKNYEIQIASVAGESQISNNTTSGLKTKVLAEKNINWFLVTLGIGVLGLGGGFVLYKMKKGKIDAKIYN